MQPPILPKKKSRNFVKEGNVKIRWRKVRGRTLVDLRKWLPEKNRVSFSDHHEAIAYCERLALELNAGGSSSQALTDADRAAYALALREAAARKMSVEAMVAEWAQARDLADRADRPLVELARAGVASLEAPSISIVEVVEELIASKERHDFHGRYCRGIRKTGELLGSAIPGPIREAKSAQIEAFVNDFKTRSGTKVGDWRRNNVLKEIRAIFRFAYIREYLPARITEASKVPLIKRVRSKIGIVSKAAMEMYLAHVADHFLPWLAINAFSGVRTEEIALAHDGPKRKDPLRWEDFNWDAGEINVRPETSKTGIARPCPILPNLEAWLAPWRDAGCKGLVCPRISGKIARPDKERMRFIEIARAALLRDTSRELFPLEYPRNGFRHTYCSMRTAILRDQAKVAYEAGNSIAMQKRNYNNPRPLAEAEAWFSIMPPAGVKRAIPGVLRLIA